MKGTEKIIAHIQADAKAQADAILAQAEQQCAEIRQNYEIKARDAYGEKIRVGVKANQDKLDSIHTPIGLDIGALSVQEIAVSIAAQLVQTRRRGLNRRSKSHILTEETFRADVVEDIVSNPLKKALLLVYETSGSTPVKSGSFMTVNEMFQAKGTIGGGCSESAVLRDAFHLIGTGESKCVTVDMNNDVAAEQGMVCGGQMKIFLTDLNEI